MNKLVLITSIIKPPNTPLSYAVRSVFTNEQRYEQTKQTIASVRDKIPDAKIFLVECSELNNEENNYFTQNADYILNLYNTDLRQNMYSQSKSLCEGTMTYCALKQIESANIQYDILIKISGRYWLSKQFDYNIFNNNSPVVKYISNDSTNVFTALYKLPQQYVSSFAKFLQNSVNDMLNCVGFEILFAKFIKELSAGDLIMLKTIGIAGYVSVSGEYYEG